MPLADQNRAIESFRVGQVNVLVATDTLQEGIDVPDCEWVVRFDEFTTTKAHIQGSGRARSLKAQIYYMANDPDMEQCRAAMMTQVARDTHVVATEQRRQVVDDKEQRRIASSRGVHPFEEPGCQPVHFFNGLEVVYNWCQQLLGQAFVADDIFSYSEEGDLLSLQVPGPSGNENLDAAEVDHHWGALRLEDALDKKRLRNFSSKEKERRRALFVMAVTLRRKGYLDESNEPKAICIRMAQETQRARFRPVKVSIGKVYPRDNPQVKNGNFASALSEWTQRKWPMLVAGECLKYTEIQSDDGWVSSLYVKPLGKTFKGSGCASKKAAQQSVAELAYHDLLQ
eukprot:TRINITY_DN48783_c0_g1_i1.p2 TRINITY_DN48783_c0_g1~~TRINITY_DN48783_c0_g1_i1.p2  ORF type:complete len:341 (-),score=72.59 TRINITY_DN48783_c0_g1_i1:157-1179(-)